MQKSEFFFEKLQPDDFGKAEIIDPEWEDEMTLAEWDAIRPARLTTQVDESWWQ